MRSTPSCLRSGCVVFAFRFFVFEFRFFVFAFHPVALTPHGHWLSGLFTALYLLSTFLLPSGHCG